MSKSNNHIANLNIVLFVAILAIGFMFYSTYAPSSSVNEENFAGKGTWTGSDGERSFSKVRFRGKPIIPTTVQKAPFGSGSSNTNNKPNIERMSTQYVELGDEVIVEVVATDVDRDIITLEQLGEVGANSIDENSELIIISSSAGETNAEFRWQPGAYESDLFFSEEDIGTFLIYFKATDEHGSSNLKAVKIVVS